VRAVDCEYLKCLRSASTDPAWHIASLTIPSGSDGIAEVDEAGFTYGKMIERTEANPCFVGSSLFQSGAEKIADYGHSHNYTDNSVYQQGDLEEKNTSRMTSAG